MSGRAVEQFDRSRLAASATQRPEQIVGDRRLAASRAALRQAAAVCPTSVGLLDEPPAGRLYRSGIHRIKPREDPDLLG